MHLDSSLKIELATPADRDQIVRFNARLAAETESLKLTPARLRDGVQAVLDGGMAARYWVARRDGRVVGQLMVQTEWSEWRNGEFWWIHSVYVCPEARGQGVFQALYRHVETLARGRDDIAGLRLYVEHHNQQATAVYKKLGMSDSGYRVMEIEFTESGEKQAC